MPSSIAKEYQEQFLEIMIDEYQDSNLIQETILTSISTICEIQSCRFIVGNTSQTSCHNLPENIIHAVQHFPSAPEILVQVDPLCPGVLDTISVEFKGDGQRPDLPVFL